MKIINYLAPALLAQGIGVWARFLALRNRPAKALARRPSAQRALQPSPRRKITPFDAVHQETLVGFPQARVQRCFRGSAGDLGRWAAHGHAQDG
jgi:hypothetical protein